MIKTKVKIDFQGSDVVEVTNMTDIRLENCLLDIKNILYGTICYQTFDLSPNETITFQLSKDNFYEEWKDEKFNVKFYSNHKLIIEKSYNDKSKCFVILTNDKFEKLAEQLIIGLVKYTDIDILHYNIGYKSTLNYPNLKNIEFGIGEDTNDPHYMQFSKAPVFLDVIEKGYKNCIFLDVDIQVRPNIYKMFELLSEIEDGPIFQKGAHDYTLVGKEYVPGPLVQNLLELPNQKYPHGITNVVLFTNNHKNLFQQWKDVCFSKEIKEIKKVEFLHDELLLNGLMWKNNIKPKYYWFGLNIDSIEDVKFFYNYNNNTFNDRVDLNDYGIGHPFQSFIPFDKEQIMFFHCIKDPNVAKKINDYVSEREYGSFSDRISSFYKDIKFTENRILEKTNIQIISHYIDGPYVEILCNEKRNFIVNFFDGKMKLIHRSEITSNMWTRANKRYYDDYTVQIIENGEVIFEEQINLENKRVLITIESSSLGDSLAWMPYAEEFRKKHNCEVILSTFNNEVFEQNYPNLIFSKPGEVVHNLHALYRIGWYYDASMEVDYSRVPNNFRMQPMQKTASDILGLEYKEVMPLLTLPNVEKKRKVGIAIHATAQAKYWNNPTGWQEVVDYLNSLNYEVMLYSREGDGYMGNYHPSGITKYPGGTLQDVINDLATCEFFIGIGSGLSWLSWATKLPTIIVSGFSYDYTETISNTWRVINKKTCTGCFNTHRLDPGAWNWCPIFKGTEKHFECSKEISSQVVIDKINDVINTLRN